MTFCDYSNIKSIVVAENAEGFDIKTPQFAVFRL